MFRTPTPMFRIPRPMFRIPKRECPDASPRRRALRSRCPGGAASRRCAARGRGRP
jgi:hypothetical protein